jgi:hypothetical protein
MKRIIAGLALVLAVGASAEQYFDCKQTGESDSFTRAPSKVELDEAGKWFLREDGKSVKKFSVKVTRKAILVDHSRVQNGLTILASYRFEHGRCDSYGEATAWYTRSAQPDEGSTGPNYVSAVYKCTCGVD